MYILVVVDDDDVFRVFMGFLWCCMFIIYIGYWNGEKILLGIVWLYWVKKGGFVDFVVDICMVVIDFVDWVVVGVCGVLFGVDFGLVDLDMEY